MPILEQSLDHPAAAAARLGHQRLFGAKWPNKIVNAVAVGSTGLSFLCALEAVREFFAAFAGTDSLG